MPQTKQEKNNAYSTKEVFVILLTLLMGSVFILGFLSKEKILEAISLMLTVAYALKEVLKHI